LLWTINMTWNRGFVVFFLCCSFVAAVSAKETITGKPTTKFFNCPQSVGSKVSNVFKTLVGRNTQPDLCFDVVLKELSVKVGTPGTDDDVIAQVCSDVDAKQCCKTPVLKSALFDDWSKGDTEVWGESYFGTKKGECKNFSFKVKRGLSVTLSKSGDGGLQVKSIDVRTRSKDPKKIPDQINFNCGTFLFGRGRAREQNNLCMPGPYFLGRIDSMNVTTGNDGTSDSVMYKICSDVDDFCCQANPGRALSNDYKKGATDKRISTDFGDCAKHLIKIRSEPVITASKNGKDHLKVSGAQFGFKRQDQNRIERFRCTGFSFQTECKPITACTQKLSCNKI